MISIIRIESSHDDWLELASQTYLKKIKSYLPIEIINIKSIKLTREKSIQKIELESKEIIKKIDKKSKIILCDESGNKYPTHELFKKLVTQFERQNQTTTFIIGGAFGVSEEIKSLANFKINLSPFTLGHQIAQIVLMEQIFRCLTIWKNVPYHNE